MGGAQDATNIISSSGLAASVITTIGEEHLAAVLVRINMIIWTDKTMFWLVSIFGYTAKYGFLLYMLHLQNL